jgi:hypothetical protein
MFRIILSCDGVPPSVASEAALDIAAEFTEHRPWHRNVSCRWTGSHLILQVENDFDSEGLALMDEFSDCLSAYIDEAFDGEIKLESLTNLKNGT